METRLQRIHLIVNDILNLQRYSSHTSQTSVVERIRRCAAIMNA